MGYTSPTLKHATKIAPSFFSREIGVIPIGLILAEFVGYLMYTDNLMEQLPAYPDVPPDPPIPKVPIFGKGLTIAHAVRGGVEIALRHHDFPPKRNSPQYLSQTHFNTLVNYAHKFAIRAPSEYKRKEKVRKCAVFNLVCWTAKENVPRPDMWWEKYSEPGSKLPTEVRWGRHSSLIRTLIPYELAVRGYFRYPDQPSSRFYTVEDTDAELEHLWKLVPAIYRQPAIMKFILTPDKKRRLYIGFKGTAYRKLVLSDANRGPFLMRSYDSFVRERMASILSIDDVVKERIVERVKAAVSEIQNKYGITEAQARKVLFEGLFEMHASNPYIKEAIWSYLDASGGAPDEIPVEVLAQLVIGGILKSQDALEKAGKIVEKINMANVGFLLVVATTVVAWNLLPPEWKDPVKLGKKLYEWAKEHIKIDVTPSKPPPSPPPPKEGIPWLLVAAGALILIGLTSE